MRINHQFLDNDFFFPNWEIDTLVLGTFNPECGEKTDYFYGRSKNRFWRAIEVITGNENYYFLNSLIRKKKIMIEKKFGCIDIVKFIEIDKTYKDKICGNGYSDSALFTLKNVNANYQFDDIKNYSVEKKVKKIIYTWGKRNSPNIFKSQIEDLKAFCRIHKIEFINNCPSPSPRSRNNIDIIVAFYNQHILN